MNNTAKMKRVRWIGMVGLFVLVSLSLIAAKPGDSQKEHVSGLVYIDANHNGVWDVGEEGYDGEYGVAKEEGDWVWRHRGATITFTHIGSGPGEDDDYPFLLLAKVESHLLTLVSPLFSATRFALSAGGRSKLQPLQIAIN